MNRPNSSAQSGTTFLEISQKASNQIFALGGAKPNIAYEWLNSVFDIYPIADVLFFPSKYDAALPTAVESLSKEQRLDFIRKLRKSSGLGEVAKMLVGSDVDLFSVLLKREDLKDMRFAPLQLFGDLDGDEESGVESVSERWKQMTLLALEAGFNESDIVRSAAGNSFSWRGALSSSYERRMKPFQELLKSTNSRLRQIGKIGHEHYSRLHQGALAAEKRAEIKGEVY